METSQHWNWRLTVVKTIKMILVRPTSRLLSELTVMFLNVVSSSAYKSSWPLIVRGWGESQSLDRHLPPYQLPASKIKQTFHQPGLFNGFWVASGRTPLSFTLFSSIQFSGSVMSDSLQSHGVQYARPPCPSPIPGVYSSSSPLSRWCHSTILSSIMSFSHHQSFPASGSFQMSQLFTSGGQSIGVSASASVLSMNIQDWFPLGWTGWISLQSKGLSRVFSNTTVQKHQFFSPPSAFFNNLTLTSIHDYWKNHSLD